MKTYFIAKKFDKREVGCEINLSESIAENLLGRGVISENPIIESAEEVIEEIQETEKVNEIVEEKVITEEVIEEEIELIDEEKKVKIKSKNK